MRIQKYLAHQGVASRRAAEKMIAAGRVRLNGRQVIDFGVLIDPQNDCLEVDGQKVGAAPRPRYLLLYKPGGYICSAHDEKGRRTVLDLLKGVKERVYPVGRLDYNTAGLLLLTNDGDLTYKLLHPSHEVTKTYVAEVTGVPDRAALEQLRRGVKLTDGVTAPAAVRLRRRGADGAQLEITIHEGRNRQVRRMLDAVGFPVRHLRRTKFAFLDLAGLKPGEWRELRPAEVQKLRAL
ncbi:MAG: rRNA pseudouridine synthase [Clostridia bacterium]|nr:rRNA pseudouridine synthase [Clostridia bacterium]